MTTIPCSDCLGTGSVPYPGSYEQQPCPRIRCIAGQIELTDAEVKAMEAEQANIRG